MRDRKGMGLDGKRAGKELWGLDGDETVVRLYSMRKKNYFQLKKEK